MIEWNPITTPNFTRAEMACRCPNCDGLALMDQGFMEKLQAIRDEIGVPLTITSGYRCSNHPYEALKNKPGWHNKGRAADVSVMGGARMRFIELALKHGMRGFGFGEKFQHIDDRDQLASWTYGG